MSQRQGPSFTLSELFEISTHFVRFAESIGRPMTKIEKAPHRWLMMAWESKSIRAECRGISEKRMLEIVRVMEALRAVFVPDPVRQERFKRKYDGHAPTPSQGNNRIVIEPMFGVEERQMTEAEASDRVTLLARQVRSIRFLMKELAAYHGSKRTIIFGNWLSKFNHLAAGLLKRLDVDPAPANIDKAKRRVITEPITQGQ